MKLNYKSLSSGFFGDIFGAEYPDWVRALKKKSGVYVIQRKWDGECLYVGESHTGRLYETLTRHFQAWSGRTAGPTWDRAEVLVAVKVTPAGRAVAEQNAVICRLKPRENSVSPLCELPENPF